MRKLLNRPWFAVLLAVAAFLLIGREFLPGSKPVNAGDGLPVPAEEELLEPENGGRLSIAAALKAVRGQGTVRDPFAVPAAKADEEGEGMPEPERTERLHLSATWIQGATVLVLLNGRVCEPGETLGRFSVVSATREGAWIAHDGQRSFLPVGQDLVVRISGSTVALLSP